MDDLKIAAVCMHSVTGEIERNLERMQSFVSEASKAGADIVCFPELCVTGYVLKRPLDVYGSPERALRRLSPDLVILLETELWPNILRAAKKRGVRTMLANGRVSVRSLANYRRLGFLFREVTGYLDTMAMIRRLFLMRKVLRVTVFLPPWLKTGKQKH